MDKKKLIGILAALVVIVLVVLWATGVFNGKAPEAVEEVKDAVEEKVDDAKEAVEGAAEEVKDAVEGN